MQTFPKTKDDFLDLVDQAIYEVDEIMMCAADEGDPEDSQYSAVLPLFEQLRHQLRRIARRRDRGPACLSAMVPSLRSCRWYKSGATIFHSTISSRR